MKIQKYFSSLLRSLVGNPVLYKIYEKVLWNQISNGKKPEHIGIILDGNRRWASERLMVPWIGHEFGADKVEDLLEWCLELGVKTVTLYVFSTENFQRPPTEVGKIMNLLEKKLIKILEDERIYKNEIKIKAIGRTYLLPSRLQDIIHHSEENTKKYDGLYLNIAVAYGGRAEIIDATKQIAKDVKEGKININEIDERAIEERLYTSHLPKPDPDLIIRTSGEERLSGFLLWQSAYSELCFLDAFWPDIRRIDLWRVIRTYQQRQRRFGH